MKAKQKINQRGQLSGGYIEMKGKGGRTLSDGYTDMGEIRKALNDGYIEMEVKGEN